MKTTPVKGTNDYTPQEAEVRDYLQDRILTVYRRYGYERIVTPILEDAENLDKSEGGDNLNLVFKILKRGEKLGEALDKRDLSDLSDMGLRYDLTLPLCRYVANNQARLLYPFKVIQMGTVYRAERPQKGRLREFMQCDIDVIGSSSPNIEIELLHVAAEALLAIGLRRFTIKVNDRRVLKSMLQGMGFPAQELDSVCISFDKLDKLGIEGVAAELTEKELPTEAISALSRQIQDQSLTLENLTSSLEEQEAAQNLRYIVEESERMAGRNAKKYDGADYHVVFDPSLVRGQGYYTGTVFEIESDEFKGSISGGGRYDNLIGKFIKDDVPAVGISIGFERIFSILMASDFAIPDQKKRLALFYDPKDFTKAFDKAESLRGDYTVTLLEKPRKLAPYLNRLKEKGMWGFLNVGSGDEITPLS